MAKLKRTKLFPAASREPVVSGLGLPLFAVMSLFGAFILTMVLFRSWRLWLILFCLWGAVGFLIRLRIQRDHNAFRVDRLWLKTKAFFLDADAWGGVTVRSFPPRPRFIQRGAPPR